MLATGPGDGIRVVSERPDVMAADEVVIAVTLTAEAEPSLRVLKGGTHAFLNGVPIGADPRPLLHGDRLAMAGAEVRFGDEASLQETQRVVAADAAPDAIASPGAALARSRGRLVSLGDGREFAIDASGARLGRDVQSDIVLRSPAASRHHAVINRTSSGYVIEDTSRNGTWVNGGRVRGALALARGDLLRLGTDEFRFHAEAEPAEAVRTLREVPALQVTGVLPAVPRPDAGERAEPVRSLHEVPSLQVTGMLPAVPRPVATPPQEAPSGASSAAPVAATGAVPVPATRPAPLATLEVRNPGPAQGTRYDLLTPVVHVGRGSHNEVVLRDDSVSTSHATLQRRGEQWVVVDLDSTNGTYLAGVRVHGERALASGADVRFGGVKLTFRIVAQPTDGGGDTRVIVGLRAPEPARVTDGRPVRAPGRRTARWLVGLLVVLLAVALFLALQGRSWS